MGNLLLFLVFDIYDGQAKINGRWNVVYVTSLPRTTCSKQVCFSAINPILYNAMSTKFRREFQRLLRCGEQTPRAGASTLHDLTRGATRQPRRRKADSVSTTTINLRHHEESEGKPQQSWPRVDSGRQRWWGQEVLWWGLLDCNELCSRKDWQIINH